MKKNISAKIAAIFLLGILLTPGVNAKIIEAKNTKIENEEEPTCFGQIYGGTYYIRGWGVYALYFVDIEVENESILTRKTNSGIRCSYTVNGLPLGYTYNVTASAPYTYIEKDGKYYGFYNETYQITLTAENSKVEASFYLEINYDDPIDKEGGNARSKKILLRNYIIRKTGLFYFPLLRLARILGRTFSAPLPLCLKPLPF
jgi:hypothetical protein